jgi:nitrogen fixation-related uncharacterized protein
MSIVVMQVFVSLLLVAGSIVLFVHTVRQRDFDHSDRLALAPLEEDQLTPEPQPPCKQSASNTTTP